MIRIAHTSDDFAPYNKPCTGVPFFFDDHNMTILELPSLWLVDVSIVNGRTRSPRTWNSYAEALADWLRACEASGWDWRAATEGLAAAYRNGMLLNGSPYTGKPYARSTINGYLLRVAMFYEWAVRLGHLNASPFLKEQRLGPPSYERLLKHLDAGARERRRLLLPTERRLPHCYSKAECRQILAALDPRESLITQWALTTGARLHEILALDVRQIPVGGSYRSNTMVKVPITVTKGSRPRDLFVPALVLDRTNRYIKFDRTRPPKEAAGALWISAQRSRLSRKTVQAAFRNVRSSSGITGRFHDLRHTYAINMLALLMDRQKRPDGHDSNPMKALQLLLGHKSITSVSIYLEALSIYATLSEINILDLVTDGSSQ